MARCQHFQLFAVPMLEQPTKINEQGLQRLANQLEFAFTLGQAKLTVLGAHWSSGYNTDHAWFGVRGINRIITQAMLQGS